MDQDPKDFGPQRSHGEGGGSPGPWHDSRVVEGLSWTPQLELPVQRDTKLHKRWSTKTNVLRIPPTVLPESMDT